MNGWISRPRDVKKSISKLFKIVNWARGGKRFISHGSHQKTQTYA